MRIEKSVGAVIFRSEQEPRYLLLKYGAGHWDFVKGHIEEGEKEQETLLRETREETGIDDLEIIPGFREVIDYHYRSGRELVYKQVAFYLAETQNREVKLSFEHVDYRWLPFSSALEQLTYQNARRVLEKARDFLATLPSSNRKA